MRILGLFFGIISILSIVLFDSCSSGKVAFEHGNYYESVMTSVARLRRNTDHKKSVETLRQAYPLAVNYYEDQAKQSLASNAEFKWSSVVQSYTMINNMYDEIKRAPGALAVIPNPVNYHDKLDEAKRNAAEENYQAGILALSTGNRDKAKLAYGLFKKANEFVVGYKDVVKMMEAALWAATIKVLVTPIPATRNVSVSAQFFDDKISEFLHQTAINEFVKFYTADEAKTLKLNPDHIIQLEFDEFTVGQVALHEQQIQLEKDSVVVATYITPGTPVNTGGAVVAGGTTQTGTGNQGSSNTSGNTGNQNQGSNGQNQGATGGQNNSGTQSGQRNQNQTNTGGQTNSGNPGNQNQTNTGGQNNSSDQSNQNQGSTGGQNNSGNQGNQNSGNSGGQNNSGNQGNQNSGNQGQGNAGGQNNSGGQGNQGQGNQNQQEEEKVTICHKPPGNTENAQTLIVPKSALQAHLAHGDALGYCAEDTKGNQKEEKKPDEKKPDDKKTNDKKGGSNGGGAVGSLFSINEQALIASSTVKPWMVGFDQSDTTKVYAKVKATYYHYQKTTTSKGIVSFRIIDAKTKAILSAEKMPGQYVWVSEWATFNGDERALTPLQLEVSKQKEKVPPPVQDLFIEFTKPIYSQITTKIQNFYKSY